MSKLTKWLRRISLVLVTKQDLLHEIRERDVRIEALRGNIEHHSHEKWVAIAERNIIKAAQDGLYAIIAGYKAKSLEMHERIDELELERGNLRVLGQSLAYEAAIRRLNDEPRALNAPV